MHVYRVYEQEYLNSESLESLNSDARVFSKNKNFISHGKSFFINFKLIENLNIILRNLHGACLSRVISAIMSLVHLMRADYAKHDCGRYIGEICFCRPRIILKDEQEAVNPVR